MTKSAHQRCFCVALVVSSLGTMATPARARPPRRADVNIFGEGGLIELPRATLLGDGYYSFGVWANYFYGGGAQAFRASPVSFGLGLPAHFDIAFSFSSTARDDPDRRADEIQLRTSLKYAILNEPRDPITLALAMRVENAFSRPDLTPFVIVDRHIGKRLAVSTLAGYRLATDRSRRDHFIFGAGGEYRLSYKLSVQLEGQVDVAFAGGVTGIAGRAAFRWDIFRRLGVALVVGGGGFGRPAARILLGLRYRPSATGFADSDGDGVPDEKDACPDEPEDRDGWLDSDGCPDPDNDGDGIPDKLDPTPNGENDKGLHKGPVRMRMRIRQAPIPTWIMHSGSEDAKSDDPETGDGESPEKRGETQP
ncbi:MAG: hypothetical protein KAI47_12270 [Deltaproteobacteria bacterium]|nr:hypothetical protein [Deltaproteobacteria bacterium]